VVNDQRVGFSIDGGINQGLVCSDADHNMRYCVATCYLQAVDCDIFKVTAIEIGIEMLGQNAA